MHKYQTRQIFQILYQFNLCEHDKQIYPSLEGQMLQGAHKTNTYDV